MHSTRGGQWTFRRTQFRRGCRFVSGDLLAILCSHAFSGAASRCHISGAVGQVLVLGGLRMRVGRVRL